MNRVLPRRGTDLAARLEALREALAVAEGRLPEPDLGLIRDLLERSDRRLGLGMGFTVAALAGGTGSGKSSLFNAMSGSDLSAAGARRPTTGVAHACVWGDESPAALLDWLAVPRRHRQASTGDSDLDGLVLLDLPDSDSTEIAHRIEVDRLVEIVDLLVWILDPQKYADAALHERYLRPLATHAQVMLLVLNQVDRLEATDRESCLTDIARLAQADGLASVSVIATSATTGEGIEELRAELARRVQARRTAVDRLDADASRAADLLAVYCSGKAPREVKTRLRDDLVEALSDAGSVEKVADAVAQAHMHHAILATGSPFTRWLRRFRPDPLKRLHLLSGSEKTVDRTSLPGPTPVQRAKIGTALRRLGEGSSEGLPEPWPRVMLERATQDEGRLPTQLDRTVAGTELGEARRPRWWRAIGILQGLLAAAAVAGAVWLMILFFFDWLQLPALPLPRVRRLPWPTLLLMGGVLAGLLVAFVARQLASVGARRRRWTARRRLRAQIEDLADAGPVRTLNEELEAYNRFCAALDKSGGVRRGLLQR